MRNTLKILHGGFLVSFSGNLVSQRPEHSCIKASCIRLRCERADPPNGVRECAQLRTIQHYIPRRSTKITLNQLFLILLTIPVQLEGPPIPVGPLEKPVSNMI